MKTTEGRTTEGGKAGRRGAAAWLAPTLAFIAMAGPFGVAGKLALEEMAWQELLLWTALAYIALSLVILVGFREGLRIVPAARWGALAGVFVIGTFLSISLALERGEASQVVPVTAAYPVFTAVLAVIVLGERMSVRRVLGTCLVVVGVVVVSI